MDPTLWKKSCELLNFQGGALSNVQIEKHLQAYRWFKLIDIILLTKFIDKWLIYEQTPWRTSTMYYNLFAEENSLKCLQKLS